MTDRRTRRQEHRWGLLRGPARPDAAAQYQTARHTAAAAAAAAVAVAVVVVAVIVDVDVDDAVLVLLAVACAVVVTVLVCSVRLRLCYREPQPQAARAPLLSDACLSVAPTVGAALSPTHRREFAAVVVAAAVADAVVANAVCSHRDVWSALQATYHRMHAQQQEQHGSEQELTQSVPADLQQAQPAQVPVETTHAVMPVFDRRLFVAHAPLAAALQTTTTPTKRYQLK